MIQIYTLTNFVSLDSYNPTIISGIENSAGINTIHGVDWTTNMRLAASVRHRNKKIWKIYELYWFKLSSIAVVLNFTIFVGFYNL